MNYTPVIDGGSTSYGSPTDGEGLILPTNFAIRAAGLHVWAINDAADQALALGERVLSRMTSISDSWSQLEAQEYYQGPEQGAVYALMDPAQVAAQEWRDRFATMSTRLREWAYILDHIRVRLEEFEERAWAFRAEALAGYDVDPMAGDWEATTATDGNAVVEVETHVGWRSHTPAFEQNEALKAEHAGFVSEVSDQAAAIANEINRLVSHRHEPGIESGFSPEEIQASWGVAPTEDRNMFEQIGDGFANLWNEFYASGNALFAYDVTTRQFDLEVPPCSRRAC